MQSFLSKLARFFNLCDAIAGLSLRIEECVLVPIAEELTDEIRTAIQNFLVVKRAPELQNGLPGCETDLRIVKRASVL